MVFITRIPTHDNEGVAFSTAVRQAILNDVVLKFGGFSLDGPGEGAWLADDGTIYAEHSYVLTVHCDRRRYPAARTLVLDIGRRLKQLAMYFEVRYFDGVEILAIETDVEGDGP